MSPAQRNRMLLMISIAIGVSVSAALVLIALSKNINLFYTPEDILLNRVAQQQSVRMGGMVVPQSVIKSPNLDVEFAITDYQHTVKVKYHGMLPDLFKENQGVVVQGALNGEEFIAKQVLAKHDEKYMPPTVAKKVGA